MKTWIVSYADSAFLSSRQRLMESATRHGIDECRPWGRHELERTGFYASHKATLDQPRGGGYWLWKPFIIDDTLTKMASGDLLVYSDAGIDIIADLHPLFRLCADKTDILLFAGHYDDAGAPGPNVCAKWTKRDCFAFLDCDEPRYHDARMLDASFMVVTKRPAAIALVREWLRLCCQPRLLTDQPNACGLPNLPTFIEHRHDQSLLSILAAREGLELFRHPSQHGNHVKEPRDREPGEWTRCPYDDRGIYHNSPYPTLLNHHRGRLGQTDLRVALSRYVRALPRQVFQAWIDTAVMKRWSLAGRRVRTAEANVRVGGQYAMTSGYGPERSLRLAGTFIEVNPPARLVYSWPWRTRVTVDFQEARDGTSVRLTHESFPSEKLREYHAAAWRSFLDTVAACLETGW